MYRISAKVFFQGIEDTVDLLMKENHIRFSTIIEPGELSIEPDLIKTVCLNLLDNSRKAVGGNARISLKGHPVERGYSRRPPSKTTASGVGTCSGRKRSARSALTKERSSDAATTSSSATRQKS